MCDVDLTFHTPREASPVSKYKQRQLFPVKILNALSSFIGRVGEPNLSCLGYHLNNE